MIILTYLICWLYSIYIINTWSIYRSSELTQIVDCVHCLYMGTILLCTEVHCMRTQVNIFKCILLSTGHNYMNNHHWSLGLNRCMTKRSMYVIILCWYWYLELCYWKPYGNVEMLTNYLECVLFPLAKYWLVSFDRLMATVYVSTIHIFSLCLLFV